MGAQSFVSLLWAPVRESQRQTFYRGMLVLTLPIGTNMKRILGIDPGRTTGYVDIDLHENGEYRVADVAEIAWENRFDLLDFIGASWPDGQPHLPDIIVVESFRLYPHKAKSQIGNDFPSSQVIGIIELSAHIHHISYNVLFQPASSIARVKVLQDLSAADDIRDAYKHARLYIVTSAN